MKIKCQGKNWEEKTYLFYISIILTITSPTLGDRPANEAEKRCQYYM